MESAAPRRWALTRFVSGPPATNEARCPGLTLNAEGFCELL